MFLPADKGIGAAVGAMLCGSSEFIDRAAVWRARYGGRMVTTAPLSIDMAAMLHEARESDKFGKSFERMKAAAAAVKALGEPRLRFEPEVPQSAMTHVYLRAGEPHSAEEGREALRAAAEALKEGTGIELLGNLQPKFNDGGPQYGSKTGSGPEAGTVRVGKEGMEDDAWCFEWQIPAALLELPVEEVGELVSGAWRQFFAVLDGGAAKL